MSRQTGQDQYREIFLDYANLQSIFFYR